MICKKCGYDNDENAIFCKCCNEKLKKKKGKLSLNKEENSNVNTAIGSNTSDIDINDNPIEYRPPHEDNPMYDRGSNHGKKKNKFLPIILGIVAILAVVCIAGKILGGDSENDDVVDYDYTADEDYEDYQEDTNEYISESDEYSQGDTYIDEYSDEDYIIPYSDTQLLTYSDVENLTEKEINYAKNEIFARKGRRFNSSELQSYFDSKSWYYGTIAPDDFDPDTMFNSIEYENVLFLMDVEKNM